MDLPGQPGDVLSPDPSLVGGGDAYESIRDNGDRAHGFGRSD